MILPPIIRDIQGILFSTDLLLALVVITVTIGISANAMDQIGGMMQDCSSRSALERSAMEATDILIKTPGNPNNWEKCSENSEVSPGLAKINNSNQKVIACTLSYEKISKLTEHYDNIIIGKIFPDHIGSSMVIYPINPQLEPIVIKNESILSQSPEIVVINRTIQYDVMSNNTILSFDTSTTPTSPDHDPLEFKKQDICPHINSNNNVKHVPYEHNSQHYWICKYFQVSKEQLNTTDYYLLSSSTELSYWGVLDTADNNNDERIYCTSPVNLNERILQLMGQENETVIWFHLFVETPPSVKAYLVGVPKNTPPKDLKLEYFELQPAYFILKAWVRN